MYSLFSSPVTCSLEPPAHGSLASHLHNFQAEKPLQIQTPELSWAEASWAKQDTGRSSSHLMLGSWYDFAPRSPQTLTPKVSPTVRTDQPPQHPLWVSFWAVGRQWGQSITSNLWKSRDCWDVILSCHLGEFYSLEV